MQPGRILVVDDNRDLCWILAKLLSERGHEVRVAECGSAALRQVSSGFDCQAAVVDYRLPDSNGITLLSEIVALRPRVRGILMTSYGNAELRSRTLDQRLFAYFNKPFNNNVIIETIEDAVAAWSKNRDSLVAGTRTGTGFPS